MKSLIPLLLIIFLSACEIHYGEVEPPPRPPSVPESALWTGGLDGGVFVDISKTKIPKTYAGSIYADFTGVILFQGKFKYTGENDFDVSDRFSYGAWDGDYLFLRNNEKLIAIHTD